MGKIIKGKFAYKDNKKISKKESKRQQEKLLKKQDKELKMRCECNHLDNKHNKAHFKKSDDGRIMTCKICGGEILAKKEDLDKTAIEQAQLTVYTLFSLVRNKLNISDDVDKQITKTLLTVSRMPELLDIIKQNSKDKKKNKKNKKGKNKKNVKKGSYRINY